MADSRWPHVFEGRSFDGPSQLAEFAGVTRKTATLWAREGISKRPGPAGRPATNVYTIDGKDFVGLQAGADHFNVCRATIADWIRRGISSSKDTGRKDCVVFFAGREWESRAAIARFYKVSRQAVSRWLLDGRVNPPKGRSK